MKKNNINYLGETSRGEARTGKARSASRVLATAKKSSLSLSLSLSLLAGSLVAVTLVAGAFLMNPKAIASDAVDDVSITVPVACTISGTNTAHTANVVNGTYEDDIGTTTIKAYCNDSEGFAIYAAGYTGDEIGGTNSTKLVGTAASSNATIVTGTAISGNTSNWAMKLATDTNATYALTLDNGYGIYSTVPNAYTKVAHRDGMTDVGASATGSTLTTTYAAYISGTQLADTYTGKVIYTMVHPSSEVPVSSDQIAVKYNSNGSTFSGGASTNRVTYAMNPMYIGTTPTVSKSANVDSDGTQSGAYYTGEEVNTLDPITISGADKLKVVLRYGLTAGSGEILLAEGNWDGDSSITGAYYDIYPDSNTSGTDTYIFNGDTVTIAMWAWDAPATDYDYGYFAEVYPIYATEQEGTEESADVVTITTSSGTYATTTDWYGSWYADIGGTHYDFTSEAEVLAFLEDNTSTLSGTAINLYRGLTFNEAYTRASISTASGYQMQDLTKSMCNTIAVTQNQTMVDTRDSNTYLAGKLKDGNCWMLDNLALDPTDSTTAANMNSSNTNATAAAITNLLNGGNAGSNVGWSSTAVADVDTNFSNGGYTVPRINNASKDTVVTSYGAGSGKVGLYYNYCAATASTYCYEGGSSTGDASQDICPANWRMPTGGGSGEYLALYNKYNTTMDATDSASLQYNLSTPLSGYYYNSSAIVQGDWGFWWSSTYGGGYNMYLLYVDSTYVDPDLNYNRNNGNTMRCLVGE